MEYRLISLQDFGESRYKHNRLQIGVNALGLEAMGLTTNCLRSEPIHCGVCYKCVERACAFHVLGYTDPTEYMENPLASDMFPLYREQMIGTKA